ncbi:MAG: YdcF family protein [Xanthobacteraceae bacterium]
MFFVLSKTVGYLVMPSNLMMAIGLIGLALLFTRLRRLASWLIVTSLVLMAVVGYSPLGRLLLLPLEQRFPPWDGSRGAPDGIVVLGGAISPRISAARGSVALNGSAERLTVTAELARRYPDARIIFTGGSASLDPTAPLEAPFAVKEFEALGVAHDRITAEEQSRNTIENAVFSHLLANPKPGERWILVTSASHMPRAIGAFRAAGFAVEAYPVNWHTTGRRDAAELFASFTEGLAMTDYAVHEWFGLAAYWLTGKTSELFPAP